VNYSRSAVRVSHLSAGVLVDWRGLVLVPGGSAVWLAWWLPIAGNVGQPAGHVTTNTHLDAKQIQPRHSSVNIR